MPREDRGLDGDAVRAGGVEIAADLRVFAFGVLADHDEVD